MNRRSFFRGLGVAALAGPKIVQALAAHEWRDPPKVRFAPFPPNREFTAGDIANVMAEQSELLRADIIRNLAQSNPWLDLVR